MNTISYKGYLGTVNFSEKDACFYGKIEGIDGLVNFEGESVHELTEAFHEAIEIIKGSGGLPLIVFGWEGKDYSPSGAIGVAGASEAGATSVAIVVSSFGACSLLV